MPDSQSDQKPLNIAQVVNAARVGEDAFGLWHDMTRPVFNLGCLESVQGYIAESEWFLVDGLIFTHVKFGASTYRRTTRHIRGADQDYFHLHMPISGVERGQVQRQAVLAGPDRITLQDWSWPYFTVAEPTEKYGLLVPRERIERRDWIHERCPVISWQRQTLAGAALAFAWETVWYSMVLGQTSVAASLVPRFVAMVNTLVDRQWRQISTKDNCEFLLGEMTAFLDDRLDQLQLGPRDLIAAFGCSRATVHRLFTNEGGVRAYIRNQRLAQCFSELSQFPQPGRHVFEVAERWGFRSAAHFSRAFRKRFGISAAELRESALADLPACHNANGDSREIAEVHRWLSQHSE